MNKVALLIPHFNNPKGLIKSLESISYTEKVDVFIIDDGSEINKINKIEAKSFFKAQGEIYFHYLIKNQGIENALNQGIKLILLNIQYKYIARLDCGDLCVGKRFEIQEKYIENNPNIKLLGSNAIAVDTDYNFLYNTFFPEKHRTIQNKMYLNAMFLHPTIMLSTDIFS
ncbi:MAG: glycosyltransferase, partial [Flavobacterium sp.]